MEKVGLVLSGGGAQGAYQAGVLKALKKLHIKVDIVAGTSVGALNGLMVVQDDIKKCIKIWENISQANIYVENQGKNITTKNLYKKYASEFLKNGGISPIMLEKLIAEVYDETKFYNSNIDYGLVTFNLSTMKPKILTKKEIKREKIVDYAIASATCFPAFKIKYIDNEKFIDGGYYDNLPIDLAIKMGATNIIAVELKAPGIKRKVANFNGKIIRISPNNRLMSMLDFNKEKSRIAISYGYNDTLKKYNVLEGKKYTFKKGHLTKNYLNYYDKFLSLKKSYQPLLLEIKNEYDEYLKIMESCGEVFKLPEYKIYSYRKFNRLLTKAFSKTNSIDIETILEDKKITKVDKREIIKTIYINLNKDKKLMRVVFNIFKKEFLIALYLKSIQN